VWTAKTQVEGSQPFQAKTDIHLASLDIIMAVAFDFPEAETSLAKQLAFLKSRQQQDPQVHAEERSLAAETFLSPELHACVYLTQSIGVAFQSAFPRLAHWLYLQKPESRRAIQKKNHFIHQNIKKSIERLKGTEQGQTKQRCAVDQVLLREMASATKLGHLPNYYRKEICDEVSPVSRYRLPLLP
jgi:hypothetical protein